MSNVTASGRMRPRLRDAEHANLGLKGIGLPNVCRQKFEPRGHFRHGLAFDRMATGHGRGTRLPLSKRRQAWLESNDEENWSE